MFTMTLTQNRQNRKRFIRSLLFTREGNYLYLSERVMTFDRTYHNALGYQALGSKDWSSVRSEGRTTAKRDWLVINGYVTLGEAPKPFTEHYVPTKTTLVWVPNGEPRKGDNSGCSGRFDHVAGCL